MQLLKTFDENYKFIQEREKFDFKSSLNTLKEMREIRNKYAHSKPLFPPSIEDIQSDLDCMKRFVRLINGPQSLVDEITDKWNEVVRFLITPIKMKGVESEETEIVKNDSPKGFNQKENWFKKGNIYNRRTDIHKKFKGNPNSGISDCANYPYIFLFWSPEGKDFDYLDGWIEPNKIFQYSGGGQDKDMEFTRGNKAIRDHEKNNKELFLFEKVNPGYYRYIGQFRLKDYKVSHKKWIFIQFFLEYLG